MSIHIEPRIAQENQADRLSMRLLSMLVGTIVCVGCSHGQPTGFLARSGTIEATPYEGMWRQGVEGKYELVHLMMVPQNASWVLVASTGFDRKAKPHGISSYREGL